MTIDYPTVFAGVKTVLDPLAQAAWPLTIGIIVIVFRRQIGALADRVRKVQGFGMQADVAPALTAAHQGEEQSDRENAIGAAIPSNQMPGSDPVFDPLDQALRETLEDAIGADMNLKLAWAIRIRSISEANRRHEFNYRMIFGSQIKALVFLNGASPAEVETFRKFYETEVKVDPANGELHKNRSFEQWGQFLVDAEYVEIVDATDPELVRITPLGRQFCSWLGYAGAAQFKFG